MVLSMLLEEELRIFQSTNGVYEVVTLKPSGCLIAEVVMKEWKFEAPKTELNEGMEKKLCMLKDEINQLYIDILGNSKLKLTKLDAVIRTLYCLLLRTWITKRKGIAFIIRKDIARRKQWLHRLQKQAFNMTIIQVYTLTTKESWEGKLLSFMVKLHLKSTEHASGRYCSKLKTGMQFPNKQSTSIYGHSKMEYSSDGIQII